ncbi:MAG: hypothetical protein U5L09_12725 [Bacteroidales bacterium]|nr:hypothetical protein [Bacteroidales bacterium]
MGAFPGIDVGATNVNRYEDGRQQKAATQSLAPYASLNYMIFNGFLARMAGQREAGRAGAFVRREHQAGDRETPCQAGGFSLLPGVVGPLGQVKVLEEVKDLSGDRYAYEQQQKVLGTTGTFEVLQAKTAYLSDSSNLLLQKNNYRNALRKSQPADGRRSGSQLWKFTGTLAPSL